MPAHVIRIVQDKQGRYYDANRFGDDYDWWNAPPRDGGIPYVCFFSEDPKEFPDEAEEEVIARSPREAREIMRAALKRDFVDGLTITKVIPA